MTPQPITPQQTTSRDVSDAIENFFRAVLDHDDWVDGGDRLVDLRRNKVGDLVVVMSGGSQFAITVWGSNGRR